MFTKELYGLTLTSDIASYIFPNIHGDSYHGDGSFLATLRALVAPRMLEDDDLTLKIKSINYRESSFKDYDDKTKVSLLLNNIENNTISVWNVSGTENSTQSCMKIMGDTFLSVYPKFTELKELRAFVAKQADMRFYINEEDRSSVIIVASLNLRLLHLVQSLTSRLVPWYFDDNPINDMERELVRSLTLRTATRYEQMIEEFAAKYDFRGKKIEKLLKGFETASKVERIKSLERAIEVLEQDIMSCVNNYKSILKTKSQRTLELDGLKYQTSNENNESEIMDYFKCNKHLEPIGAYGSTLEFRVSCYLDNFDVEMYERISENYDGYMYNDYEPTNTVFKDVSIRKKFMDAIFSDDPILRIKTCGFYQLDLTGWVEAPSWHGYSAEYNDMIPNPHLQHHSCLGDQRPLIEELLRDHDYVGAVEQCICSAKSINVGESATFPYLLESLFSSDAGKYILLPDGTSCTPEEALKWLDEQENTEVNE